MSNTKMRRNIIRAVVAVFLTGATFASNLCLAMMSAACFNFVSPLDIPSFELDLDKVPRYDVDQRRSAAYAEKGWSDLNLYRTNQYSTNLDYAKFEFDCCWHYDRDNYNAFWGWGIIRTEEAKRESDPEKIEQRLLDAVHYLEKTAKMSSLPNSEQTNLRLDLSNALNGLGSFYLQAEKTDSARMYLEESFFMLETMLKSEPENCRIYEMLAFNAYYRKQYELARTYWTKAESLGAVFAPEFLNDLENALDGQ